MGLSIQLANNLYPATPTFRTNISRKWITTARNFFLSFFSSGWKSRLMDALVKVKLKYSSANQLSGRNSMTLVVSGHFGSSVFTEFRCAGRFADIEWLQVTADAFSPPGCEHSHLETADFRDFISEIAKSTPSGSTHDNSSDTCLPASPSIGSHQLWSSFCIAMSESPRVMRNVFTASGDHDSFTLTFPALQRSRIRPNSSHIRLNHNNIVSLSGSKLFACGGRSRQRRVCHWSRGS